MNQEELKTLVAQMLRELAPQPEPQVKGSEYRPTVPEPQPEMRLYMHGPCLRSIPGPAGRRPGRPPV